MEEHGNQIEPHRAVGGDTIRGDRGARGVEEQPRQPHRDRHADREDIDDELRDAEAQANQKAERKDRPLRLAVAIEERIRLREFLDERGEDRGSADRHVKERKRRDRTEIVGERADIQGERDADDDPGDEEEDLLLEIWLMERYELALVRLGRHGYPYTVIV